MIRLSAPHRAARDVEVAVVPMINIVFLLLLYFLVAGHLTDSEGPQIELPLGGVSSQPGPPATVILVDRHGAIWLGTDQVKTAQLREHLQALSGRSADAGVVIRADGRADVDALQTVLQACQTAGVGVIRLATIESG